MQLESLKVFCDLAETESFTKTARVNGVTQSAVSQTVTAMEKQFKALLIERSKKNFRLTPEGEVVYNHSKRILHTFGALESKIQGIKGDLAGSIRVATVGSIGLYDLPPYIKRFLKDYPTVNVRVEYRRADEVYDEVLSNGVDLGLVAFPVRDARLETIPFRSDRLVLVCHPENGLAKQKAIKLKSLEGLKFVGFDLDIPTRKALDKFFKDQGIAVEYVMQFDNIEMVKRAVEIDTGIAILPEETVKAELATKSLAAVPLEGNYSRQLAVIHKKDKILSPAMKKFIELLKKAL
ncbi:MAG TPA: LysR family transcriptional regulator [Clostridia bacterium]|nr:LysR family transcriptional regulator [Clostridia bacterium]